jgi:predicted permease
MPLPLPLRRWRRRPGLALIAVLVLSLGIGATTAMYSIVDAVLLREEPWPDADRLVRVYGVQPQLRSNPASATTWNRGGISWQSWRDLQKLPLFEDVAAWVTTDYIVGDDDPDLVRAFFASSTLPQLVGVRPLHGRFFTAAEDDKDSNTVILTHAVWMRRFGGDPDVIGTRVAVSSPGAALSDRDRRTIVGVLPASFAVPGGTPDILLPLGFHQYNGSFGNPFFRALGKLAPQASLSVAADAAEPLIRRDQPPEQRTGRLLTLRADRIGLGDQPLWLMFAGAALLLVVACANVAGLLLSDARTRHHETAVRMSLGGTRVSVLRQVMAEHATLALVAAAGGVLLAYWLIPSLVALAPPGLVGEQRVVLDREIAGWAVLAAVLTTMLAGLLPAVALSAARPGDALKTGARQVTAGGRWRHRAIVAMQFGLALVLLVGAGLFAETLLRLNREPLGFEPDNAAVFHVTRHRRSATQPVWTNTEAAKLNELRRTDINAFSRMVRSRQWVPIQSLLDSVGAFPGVAAVGAANAVPFTTALPTSGRIRAEGEPLDTGHTVYAQQVSAGYFAAMGIRVLRGRTFDESEVAESLVAVLSESAARRVFGDRDPVGRRLGREKYPIDVVGVVADTKQQRFLEDAVGTLYYPAGGPESARALVVRSAVDIGSLLPNLKREIEQHEHPMFVTSMSPLGDLVASTLAVERSRAMLSGVYGAAALLLASVGLYGLAARLVAERRREIGIRVALGAGRRDVRRLVMSDAWLIVAIGLVVGVPAAIVVSRYAQSLLYGVEPTAPHVLGIAAVCLTLAAIIATVVPAWRANRIDPAVTLRED